MSDFVGRAQTLLDIQRPRDAAALLHRHLASEPQNDQALCLLACAHLAMDDPRQALVAAGMAAAAAPNEEWPHRLASIALAADGQGAKAVVAAERALSLAPDLWLARMQLAYALGAAWRWEDALNAAKAAVALAPHEADAHAAVGYAAAGAEQWALAERAYDEALELDPAHAQAHNNLALLELKHRRLGTAARGFAAAVQDGGTRRTGAQNLRNLLWRTILPLYPAMLLCLLAVAIMNAAGTAPTASTSVMALLISAAVGVTALRVRQLPPDVRSTLARLATRGSGAVASASLLLLIAMLLLTAAAPEDHPALRTWSLAMLAAAYFAALVATT